MAIGFLRNSSTDHPPEAIGPLVFNCFWRRSVWPSVKYVDDEEKKMSGPPLIEFSGFAHDVDVL